MNEKKTDISLINKNDFKILIAGLKVLKDRHYYQEVEDELNNLKGYKEEQKVLICRLKAECKYQNKEIPSKVRFKEALDILDDLEDDAETLSLKGAVYKRKYQLQKDIKDLYQAIKYYETAAVNYKLEHESKKTAFNDEQGYASVNTIYLYKVLLDDLDASLDNMTKENYLNKINELRSNTLKHIKKYIKYFVTNQYLYPTIAELYFSCKNYKKAKKYLDKSVLKNEEEERLYNIEKSSYISNELKEIIKKAKTKETIISRAKLTTIEQFIALYKIDNKDIKSSEAINKLMSLFEGFVKEDEDSKDLPLKNIIESSYYEKMGIALSGGGFRASLFHIGVFARLAELDMLRHVEVISSVSGGSIIAMHYYLKLKRLLEENPNKDIEQSDYITLIKDMQDEFLTAIQKNIRMKAFFKEGNNSITEKLGQLYMEDIYKLVNETDPKTMDELYINPMINKKEKSFKNFNPHFHNIELKNKIPILIINSTCLNNGHNWRFTASGMGESFYMYDTTIDKNKIYKFKRYDKSNLKVSIGDAVASSSCVPGLFDPIEIDENFSDEKDTIKLVDGGVYDNQGLASILDEECKLIIVSDASGQFQDDEDPSSCRLKIVPRINDMLMDRGRDLTYSLVKNMKDSKQIVGLAIFHLKQCFDEEEKMCKKFYSQREKEIQEKLAMIRTDLDTFNDAEAYTLMNSGYNIASSWFHWTEEPYWQLLYEDKEQNYDDWKFKRIENKINNNFKWLSDLLDESKKKFFKVPFLYYRDGCVCTILTLGLAILLGFFYILFIVDLKYIILTILGVFSLIGFFIVYSLLLYKKSSQKLSKKLKKLFRGVLKKVAQFNLFCINKSYLKNGEINE